MEEKWLSLHSMHQLTCPTQFYLLSYERLYDQNFMLYKKQGNLWQRGHQLSWLTDQKVASKALHIKAPQRPFAGWDWLHFLFFIWSDHNGEHLDAKLLAKKKKENKKCRLGCWLNTALATNQSVKACNTSSCRMGDESSKVTNQLNWKSWQLATGLEFPQNNSTNLGFTKPDINLSCCFNTSLKFPFQ